MLIFQYTRTWQQFSLWNLVAVSVYSLGLVPIFVHFNIVKLDNWKSIYHMPLLFAIASLARAVTLLLIHLERRDETAARKFSSSGMFPDPAMKPTQSSEDEGDNLC
ncbi:hypothetical protein [Sporomusa malonica]|uniref:hypothetical protein n=1 Tax=Sporomusa malonica TaxID=112901 RepID=UPI00111BFCCD|nr:hypothetical protein [Sporomusa malonica]